MRFPIIFAAALTVMGCGSANAAKTVIVYGDSFSAGAGTDLSDPRLWPNKLERLLDARGRDWTVANRSINGNGLVWKTRCFGQPAADRLQADIPKIPTGEIIVLMAGINDVIQPTLPAGFSSCFDPANLAAADITSRLSDIAKARNGHRIVIATIPPFAGSEFHSDQAEAVRQETNRWIRANWPQRDIIDLDHILAGSSDTGRLRKDFDSGDGLHPNERGAEAIAAATAGKIQ